MSGYRICIKYNLKWLGTGGQGNRNSGVKGKER